MQLFPWATWLAPITSAVLLIVLYTLGDLTARGFAFLLGGFLVAGYCQFFSGSLSVGAAGLLLQTLVAIALILRWKRGA